MSVWSGGRFSALALVGLLISSAHADGEQITTLSICELAKLGNDMDGHAVRVSAIYVTDLMHTSVLKDRHCSADGVAPVKAADGMQDPSVEKFDTAMWGKLDDHELRVFAVDVSGTFHWRGDETPHGALAIEKVWHFKRHHGDWKKAK